MTSSGDDNTRSQAEVGQTGGTPDPVDILLKHMKSGFRGITGNAFNLCLALCEITEGKLGRMDQEGSLLYGWYTLGGQKKDIIQFKENSVYELIYEINGVITLHLIDQEDYARLKQRLTIHPLSILISKFEMEKEYKAALDVYKMRQLEEKQRNDAQKSKLRREDTIESILKKIEQSHSDDVIFPIRGIKNIHSLIEKGYEPGICDNPDLWVDAEEFASLYKKNQVTGEEFLLIGREKLQAVTEPDRIEYKFAVAKSKDRPKDFREKCARFNRAKRGEPPRSWKEEFFKGLDILTTYPEELKNKTVTDLEVMAKAIDGVIVERSQIDEGLLPYDALFKKETRKILVDRLAANKPLPEIRKNLDYLEHTGIIHPAYRDSLFELMLLDSAGITLYDHLASKAPEATLNFIRQLPLHKTAGIRKILEGIEIKEVSENEDFKNYIYTNGELSSSESHKQRIKVIVASILKSIPGEVNEENITVAMLPYINELGLDELDKIRQRILELQEVVATNER